jgi:hypothetical protein
MRRPFLRVRQVSSNWSFKRKFGEGSRPEKFPAKCKEIVCPFVTGKSQPQRMLGVYPGKWSYRLVTHQELLKPPSGVTYAPAEATVTAGRLIAHAIVPVALKEGVDPKLLEISLRRGVVGKGKLTGPDGQPVEGAVLISRLMVNRAMGALVQSPSPVPNIPVSANFELKGCHPDKSYPVIFFQEQTFKSRNNEFWTGGFCPR